MKNNYILLLTATVFLFSCQDLATKNDTNEDQKKEHNSIYTPSDKQIDLVVKFESFIEEFKAWGINKDSTELNKINKTGQPLNDLLIYTLEDFKASGEAEEKTYFDEDNRYIFEIFSQFEEEGEIYESAIYYHFYYNETKAQFELIELMAAG